MYKLVLVWCDGFAGVENESSEVHRVFPGEEPHHLSKLRSGIGETTRGQAGSAGTERHPGIDTEETYRFSGYGSSASWGWI